MSILRLNCRGLGDKSAVGELSKLIKVQLMNSVMPLIEKRKLLLAYDNSTCHYDYLGEHLKVFLAVSCKYSKSMSFIFLQ